MSILYMRISHRLRWRYHMPIISTLSAKSVYFVYLSFRLSLSLLLSFPVPCSVYVLCSSVFFFMKYAKYVSKVEICCLFFLLSVILNGTLNAVHPEGLFFYMRNGNPQICLLQTYSTNIFYPILCIWPPLL